MKFLKNHTAYYLLIGLLFFCLLSTFSQNKKVADSLIAIYQTTDLELNQKRDLLMDILEAASNPETRLNYADQLIKSAATDSSYLYMYSGFLHKGHGLREQGNFSEAMQVYFLSLNLTEKGEIKVGTGIVLTSIADAYSESGNSKNAQIYYEKGIQVLRELNDSLKLASALLNAGDAYFYDEKYDDALKNFSESGILFKELNYQVGSAYNLGNIGMVYARKGKHELAKQNIEKAIATLEELEDYYPISVYLTYMSDIYLERNNWNTAKYYSERSLELAKKYGLKDQISEANLQLANLFEKKESYKESYKYYKEHIVYRDSVMNLESIEKMADLRTEYEVSQKQVEVDLLEKNAEISVLKQRRQKNIIYGTVIFSVLIFLLAYGLLKRYNYIKKTNQIIESEKRRSDKLLLNILPEETALELKENGSVKARKFDSTTVLFTDFKGFTHYAENLPPEQLVQTVDYYFSKFDSIMEKYNLEKIKTVGDAYMCAAGIHTLRNNHASQMVEAAFEIIDFVQSTKLDNTININFDIRIGINTGPIVAGVVGSKKFAYDIWGDTVNIASRMESNSEVGKINISQNTFNLIKDEFNCEFRGEIAIKNRTALNMYFVKNKI
ncbi:adenylate/guanylate cyclase domain-containing protein [Urechidicola vernalis]|uniref:Adenylate/guanylate cyclase domain-containing protein n=1 Tax=Urechidicola vernalis TaxID=3075600 RepID=A0ABU2Y4I1_9FLAO|nr:adenylate/guanylate cyclase domain-containing protein [Urechidicola sp. P050]MDT0551968.1 adenylate/guanylate cyclase domain-containing protein [Urechidicola sp. P050]